MDKVLIVTSVPTAQPMPISLSVSHAHLTLSPKQDLSNISREISQCNSILQRGPRTRSPMPPWCSPSRVTCTSLFLANQMQLCKRGRDSWGSSQRMLGPILLLVPPGPGHGCVTPEKATQTLRDNGDPNP